MRIKADGAEEGALSGPAGANAMPLCSRHVPAPPHVLGGGVEEDAQHVLGLLEVDGAPSIMQVPSKATSDGLGGGFAHAPSKAFHAHAHPTMLGPSVLSHVCDERFIARPRHKPPLIEDGVDTGRDAQVCGMSADGQASVTFVGLEAQGLSFGQGQGRAFATKDQHAGRLGHAPARGRGFNALSAGRRTTKGGD